MMQPRILVAGIGNIFLGDDAFGVEVVGHLMNRRLPDEALVVDFGIRGLDLAYALLDGYEAVVLVDATPRGGPPGSLYVLELDADATAGPEGQGPSIEAHSLDPVRVLRLVRSMGGAVGRILLVGCEPSPFEESDDLRDGLSTAVDAAVDEAVVLVESLVDRLLRGEGGEASDHRVISEEEVGR
ncbi:MAG: hydrogenase maturation protease [Paludisphaera borealis]|uniref:hydrogenase maturation protease n=1 Tax=Paludisphaera borealis TaxID=1387353 RepID=UPI00284D6266|nr:hydrogenase maturation protease [Paludisphaera borealis]MDR3620223.1 hydrogenase maturation protease [Paludisphaera borealis]